MEARFPLGQIVATLGALDALSRAGQIVATLGALDALSRAGQTPDEFLRRHAAGDWKDLDAHDMAENLYSLKHGFRVSSSYRTNAGETLWLITEADRASTICPRNIKSQKRRIVREQHNSHFHRY
jgi:hypothetical protein